MKKLLILIILISVYKYSSGQANIFPASGKAGIGTITPTSQLEIIAPAAAGESLVKFRVSDALNDYMEIMNATGGATIFMPAIKGVVTSVNSAAMYLIAETNTVNDVGNNPMTIFDSRLNVGRVTNRPLFGWDSYGTRSMTMLANGNLGIGINSPAEKLAVNGNIRAKEIKVEAVNWPDYVFTKEYELPSLNETEKYIKERGHLPGIPSAAEVKSNGIDLGEMNAKLLQKIEELTLYLIELKNENKQLNRRLTKVEKETRLFVEVKTGHSGRKIRF